MTAQILKIGHTKKENGIYQDSGLSHLMNEHYHQSMPKDMVQFKLVVANGVEYGL
jgi:hypothetical protein